MSEGTGLRGRGRPRDPQTDQAILQAAIEEIGRLGYDGASLEGIAKRAGVTRPTIYRRYDNKAALVVAAIVQALQKANPAVPDTGSAEKDVATLVFNTAQMLTQTPTGAVIRAVVPALPNDRRLSDLMAQLDRERRVLMRDAIGRGMERGEFPRGDIDTLLEALLGAVYLRFLVLNKPLTRSYVNGLVESVLRPTAEST